MFRVEKGFKMFCKYLFKKSDGFEFMILIFLIYYFNINLYCLDFEGIVWYYFYYYYFIFRKMNEWLDECFLKLIFFVFKVYKVFR